MRGAIACQETSENHLESRAYQLFKLGAFDLALQTITNLIDMGLGNATAYYNRGCCRIQLDEPTLAISDFTKAIELNPGYIEALLARGLVLEATDNLLEAIEDYWAVIHKAPKVEPYVGVIPLVRQRIVWLKGDIQIC